MRLEGSEERRSLAAVSSPVRKAGLITLWTVTAIAMPLQAQAPGNNDLRQQIEMYRTAAAKAEPPAMQPVAAGRIWSRLGSLYEDAGMYEESEMAYQRALRLLKVAPVSETDLATAMDDVGTLYMMWGDTQRAERAEQKALEIREKEGLKAELPRSWYHLATLFLREHRAERARDYAKQAVDQLGAVAESNSNDMMNAQFVFALSLCRLRRYPEAIATMQAALELVRRVYRPDEFPAGFGSFLLGYAYWKSGDAAAASDLMRDGSTLVLRQLGWEHPVSICIMAQYAHFLRNTHQKRAVRSMEKKLKEARAVSGSGRVSQTLSIASLF